MDPWRATMAELVLLLFVLGSAQAWTGEIRGRVVCDVCADSSVGPEDHVLEGNLPFSSRPNPRSLLHRCFWQYLFIYNSLRVKTNPQFNFSCTVPIYGSVTWIGLWAYVYQKNHLFRVLFDEKSVWFQMCLQHYGYWGFSYWEAIQRWLKFCISNWYQSLI